MHKMKLQAKYYDFIKNGTKKIELRLNDEKRQLIKINDTIKFIKEPELTESFEVTVTGLYHSVSFDELFKDFPIEMLADSSMTKPELRSVLEEFYTPDLQNQYGVVGIRVNKKA